MRSTPRIQPLLAALALAAAALTCGSTARAQCPDWQPGFQAPGIGGDVRAFTVHADGSGQRVLVVGGYRLQIPGVPLFGTAVLTWDGSTLQALGSLPPDSIVHALESWDDGSGPAIYAGGLFPSSPLLGIARWNGATWENVGGGTNGRVQALEVFDDGTGPALYAGGEFTLAGGVTVRRVARWNGSAWSPAGTGTDGPNATVYALAVWQDSLGGPPALYAGGDFTGVGTSGANRIAKWDGTSWQPLGFGLDDRVTSIAAYDSGAGTVLYVGGWFDTAGTVPARGIAGYDGYWWFGVGSPASQGGSPSVAALEVGDLGSGPRLYATGFFATAGGVTAAGIARWNGSAWSALGIGLDAFSVEPRVHALHSFDDGRGRALYLGGQFTTADGVLVQGIARWLGGTFEALGAGATPGYEVRALADFDEGTGRGPELFAAGNFPTIGNVQVSGIGRWNGTSRSGLAGGVGAANAVSLQVYDARLGSGPALFVTGDFEYAGATYSTGIAAWSSCGETGRTLCFGDGSGTACPCGNASAPGDRDGCLNSTGLGGRLRASGAPSLANDTLVLSGLRMTNGSALYFQGTTRVNGGAGAVFGDGLRCAAGTVVRLAILSNSGGASHYPRAGDAPIATQGAVAQPGARVYQVWFRDAADFCTPATFNLTNAVEIVWGA